MERWEHLRELETRLYAAVPPIHVRPQWWLTSDAGPSYCGECVDIARGREFELGRPLTPTYHRNTSLERAFAEGIDGGFQTSGDDSPRACDICRCTLDYTLTEHGVAEELAYYAENPGFAEVGPEDTFAILQICLDLTYGGADPDQVEAAIVMVEAALAALSKPASAEGG